MKNILQSFVQQKAKGPALIPAPWDHDVRTGYNELEKRSNAFAALLKDAGCKKGDRICCMTGNMSSVLISILGIMKAGCVCVPVKSDTSREHICSTMSDVNSRWLFADDSTSSLPGPLLFETGEISLGWLGDSQKIPEGITPEFISENIDQYMLEPVSDAGRIEKSAFRFVISDDKGYLEEFNIAYAGIAAFIDRYGEILNGRFSDRVAGFFPEQLLRFFMELPGTTKQETPFYLMADSLLEKPEKLASLLYSHQITRLLVQADTAIRLTNNLTKRKIICKTVDEVIIWGKLPSRHSIADLKNVFPGCDIKNRFRGTTQRKQFPLLRHSAAKVSPFVSWNRANAAPEQNEKVILGLIEESTQNRFRSVDYIRDIKAVYLNYWRKVEEKNLWVVDPR